MKHYQESNMKFGGSTLDITQYLSGGQVNVLPIREVLYDR